MPPLLALILVASIGAASFFIGSMILGAIAWLILKPTSLFVKLIRKAVHRL